MDIPGLSVTSWLSEDEAAAVYLATSVDGRAAVLSVGRIPLTDEGTRRAFQSWATALLGVARHPHIADVLGHGLTADLRPYLAVATAPKTMADPIVDGLPRSPESVRATATALADGLAATHGFGLLHGAVKPATTLLANTGMPVLAGYDTTAPGLGLALRPDPYSAPERLAAISAPPNMAADVYELAVTLHTFAGGWLPWLTGQVPPDDPAARTVPFADPPGVPPQFAQALRWALAPNPAQRPTALQLRDALAMSPPWPPVGGRPMGAPPAAARFTGRPVSPSALRLAGAIAAGAAGGIAMTAIAASASASGAAPAAVAGFGHAAGGPIAAAAGAITPGAGTAGMSGTATAGMGAVAPVSTATAPLTATATTGLTVIKIVAVVAVAAAVTGGGVVVTKPVWQPILKPVATSSPKPAKAKPSAAPSGKTGASSRPPSPTGPAGEVAGVWHNNVSAKDWLGLNVAVTIRADGGLTVVVTGDQPSDRATCTGTMKAVGGQRYELLVQSCDGGLTANAKPTVVHLNSKGELDFEEYPGAQLLRTG